MSLSQMFTTFCNLDNSLQGMPRHHPYVFITLPRSDKLREDLLPFLDSLGATAGIICREPHSAIEDGKDGAELAAQRPFHLHVACFGKIKYGYGQFCRDAFPLDDPVTGKPCGIFAQHTHLNSDGSPNFRIKYPFPSMVKYLTAPAKDKVIDEDPLFFGCESLDELLLMYQGFLGGDTLGYLRQARDENVPEADVISYLSEVLCKDNSYMYRVWMDYYHALPPLVPKLLPTTEEDPSFLLRPWQKLMCGFATVPFHKLETNNMGAWLRLPPNSGKSVLLAALHDQYGVYIPYARLGGAYDESSMSTYNGEKIILFNDVNCHSVVKDNGEVEFHWKRSTINLFKAVCDFLPICFKFGNQEGRKYVRARVIITSNFPLPRGGSADEWDAIKRRYLEFSALEDIDAVLSEQGLLERSRFAQPVDAVQPLPVSAPEPPLSPERTQPDSPVGGPVGAPPQRGALADLADWRIESPGVRLPFGAPPSSPPGLLTRVMASRPQSTGKRTSAHFDPAAAGSSRGPLQPRRFVAPRRVDVQRPREHGCELGFHPAPLTPPKAQRELFAGYTPSGVGDSPMWADENDEYYGTFEDD